MGDAGVMGGAAADAMTLSGIQTSTGAKTYNDQKLIFRNPANTFSGTLQNPAYAANVNVEPFHQFYTYTIYRSGSNYKARNNFTGEVATSMVDTSGITVVNNAIQNLKNIETTVSGGGIFFKKGIYTLTDYINLDRADANVNINNFTMAGEGYNTILNFNPAGALNDAIFIRMHKVLIRDLQIQTAVNNITDMISINGDGKWGTIDHCWIQGHSTIPAGSQAINFETATAAVYFWHIKGCDFGQFDTCIRLNYTSGNPANAEYITQNNFGGSNWNTGIYVDSSTCYIAGNFGQMQTTTGDSLIELGSSHAFNNNIFGNTVDLGSKAGACCVKLDSGAHDNLVFGVYNTGTGAKILDNSGAKNYLNPGALFLSPTDPTVGASPYTYTNTAGYIQQVTVMGGVVSDISVSRSATPKTFYQDTNHAVTLFGGDSVIITYAVAPTVRIHPMG